MNLIWLSSFIADAVFIWLYCRKSDLTPGKPRLWLKIVLCVLLLFLYYNQFVIISGATLRVVYRAVIYFLWVWLAERIPWKGALYVSVFWVGIYTVFQNIFFGPYLGKFFTGREDILQSHLWSQVLLIAINLLIRLLYFCIISRFLPFAGMAGAVVPNILFVALIDVILVYSKTTVISSEALSEATAAQFDAYFVLLHAALLLALIVFEYSRRKTVEAAILDIRNTEAKALVEAVRGRQSSEEAIRALRHDLKNHAISMKLMLDNGETDEAQKYLDSFIEAASDTVESYHTGSELLDGLLKLKLAPAIEAGVDVGCTLDFRAAAEKIDNFDLCVLMGNVLDNAVEACAAMPAGTSKYIRISGGHAANCQLIKIDNSCVLTGRNNPGAGESSADDRPTADKLPVTTKADRTLHGFGLRNVRSVLDRYGGTMTIANDNGHYSISMLIPVPDPVISRTVSSSRE
ncbi:MAG: GHKL domain-containing protein [Firmicutes bacterium]|nr:GHKL domain-containing protein [Bacillota bacterium]